MQIFLYQYAKSNRDRLCLEGNREQLGNPKQGCTLHGDSEFLQAEGWRTEVMHAQPLAGCRQRGEGTLESEAESAPESAGALPGFGKMLCVCSFFFFEDRKLRDLDFPQATEHRVCFFYIRACFCPLTQLLGYCKIQQSPRANVFLNCCKKEWRLGRCFKKKSLLFLAFTQYIYPFSLKPLLWRFLMHK